VSTFKEEWFNEERFWQKFAPVMFDERHMSETLLVADSVTRLAGLDLYNDPAAADSAPLAPADEAAPRLLDLCCGFGRISLELCRQGFSVTGVDITETYLDAARNDAAKENLPIEFIKEDARMFKRPGFFDVAVNLYISFGYFENASDDVLVVRNVFESLKKGGAFIIETLGK
jgi:2-polyprenyl-3-methyl-5-hydroxy-6-metoxy-1,4-benzoquinol methylase